MEAREEESGHLLWSYMPLGWMGNDESSQKAFTEECFSALLPPGHYRLRYSVSEAGEFSPYDVPVPYRVLKKSVVLRGEAMTVWLD